MTFTDLLQGLAIPHSGGPTVISGLDYDSRRLRPGWVFVAMKGESTDGNRYIDVALEKGAVAVISDSTAQKPRPGVAWATVRHGRRALATASANFYGRPASKLRITGVTGTNGKTTTTFLVETILNFCGRKSALIGTIE